MAQPQPRRRRAKVEWACAAADATEASAAEDEKIVVVVPEVLQRAENRDEPGDMPQMEPVELGQVRPRKKSVATFMKVNQQCSSACCSEGIEKDCESDVAEASTKSIDVSGTAQGPWLV